MFKRACVAVAAAVTGFLLAAPASAQLSILPYAVQPASISPSEQRGAYAPPRIVAFSDQFTPGTIIIRVPYKRLYLVLNGGRAIEYRVGVGRDGFRWKGVARVGHKKEWPSWRPPQEMIERELKENGRRLPEVMEGGVENPLGARALYLFKGGRDTLYRIHGTNKPHTIGRAVSSGCIRMMNRDVVDLYSRVPVGAEVFVY